MVNLTIDQLLDGENIRTRLSKGIFQEINVTYKGSMRSNPPQQITMLKQEQLEKELNVNLEILDGDTPNISLDDSLTLTKTIKIGLSSVLHILASTSANVLTHEATGALFQNTNLANLIAELEINNLHIIGDTANSIFNIIGNAMSSVTCNGAIFQDVDFIGVIDTGAFDFASCSMRNIDKGLIFKNQGMGRIDRFSLSQPSNVGLTAVSFIAGVNPINVTIDILRAVSLGIDNSLLFLDPNSPVGSKYTITNSDSDLGDFYQQGVDVIVDSVADNGNGKARFTTNTSHNLIIGRPTVLRGFAEGTYNRTVIVTAVDVDLTGVTFDVEDITFIATDNGIVNNASLDQTDIRVLSTGNKGSPDSMFTGESGLEIFGSEFTSSELVQNEFEIITSAAFVFNNLERFEEGVVNTGQLICKDPDIKKYNISYSGTIEKSGPAGDLGVIILKNGVNVAFNAPHTVNTGKIQITGTDIIELTDTDTLDIAVINYNSTATEIITSQLSLVVSRA